MKLKEFMQTDVYKNADAVCYIGIDGSEIDEDESDLMHKAVTGYNVGSGGRLEIELKI